MASELNELVLRDGSLAFKVDLYAGYFSGDPIELYLEDHLVSSGSLLLDPEFDDVLVLNIPDLDFPPCNFPAKLSLLHVPSGEQIGASLTIPSEKTLGSMLGPPNADVRLTGIRPNSIEFEMDIGLSASYPRKLSLLVDKLKEASQSTTPVLRNRGYVHCIRFPIGKMIRNGSQIELTDAVTGIPVFEMAATWTNLVWPLTVQIDQLQNEQQLLMRKVEQLERQINISIAKTSDAHLLDRLDLFYFLLDQKIEKFGAGREATRPPTAPVVKQSRSKEVIAQKISLRALEGVGFYDVESNADGAWRWFGPRVLLAVRDIVGRPERVVLKFQKFPEPSKLPTIRVLVNDLPMAVKLSESDVGNCVVDVPVPASACRSDDMLLLHIYIDEYDTGLNDSRMLSAAFVGLTVFSNAKVAA